MGALVSNFGKKNDDEEEEKKIKEYEEQIETNPFGFGFTENEDLKKVKWWQYLIYDMRFRIAYALVIGILIGIVLPLFVYFAWFDNKDITIYGSCMIKEEARVQCRVNDAEPTNQNSCIQSDCCWNSSDTVQFHCHHSFPSAYQYHISSVRTSYTNDSIPKETIEINAQPNHQDQMSTLRIYIKELNKDHLNIQIFNPEDYPERKSTFSKETLDKLNETQEDLQIGQLIITYGKNNGYLFVRLGRNGSDQETIFDTRLGPLSCGNGFISFTTILPTPYFYGLKGGEGIASRGSITQGVVNGFENAEIPFYMALDQSGSWHGVLLDTHLPFVVQIISAPGIMFHLQGSAADLDLHIFPGPSRQEVFQQLHSYISGKLESDSRPKSPYIPPFWGLGLHLCRKSDNGSMALKEIEELNKNLTDGSSTILYDSDCIDENLRDPFGLNEIKFPNLDTILDYLRINSTKKILLTQKVTMPWNATEYDINRIESVKDMLVLDKTNKSESPPYLGFIDNNFVVYPDVFHTNVFVDLTKWGFNLGKVSPDGIIFVDNYPKNEIALSTCGKPNTFLETYFLGTTFSDPYGNSTWGSICPQMVHTLTIRNGESSKTIEKSHFEVHNVYGQETMKKLSQIVLNQTKEENPLVSSSSSWMEGLYYGGHNGMEVAFSWIGLRESLDSFLQHFILTPFSGTPICGSFLPNDSHLFDNELCLRWYQVGLLLPFAYHSYGHKNSSRGPLIFPEGYRRYLNEAVRQRFTYASYYYTLFLTYKETLIPPVVPMSYYFNNESIRKTTFSLVDQFMIGEAILAAPIVKPTLNRETYFPPGIWYDSDGFTAWESMIQGGFKTVTGHIHQTPLFIRGGYIIPTVQNPKGNSIMETREGSNNYTLLIGLISNDFSKGYLYVDNELNPDFEFRDEITFESTNNGLTSPTLTLTLKILRINSNCNNKFRTIIDQVKFLGFPSSYKNVTVSQSGADIVPGDDLNILRFYSLNLDWCVEPNEKVITIIATK